MDTNVNFKASQHKGESISLPREILEDFTKEMTFELWSMHRNFLSEKKKAKNFKFEK